MSKELEALKRVVNEISNYKLHGIGDENWLGIQDILEDIELVEQALQQAQKQEKLLELYKDLSNYVDEQTYAHELPEITRLKIIIKELEKQ